MTNSRGLKFFSEQPIALCLVAFVCVLFGMTCPAFSQTTSQPGSSKKTAPKPSKKATGKKDKQTQETKPASPSTPTPAPQEPVSKPAVELPTAGGSVVASPPLARSPKRPKQPLKFTSEERRLSTTTGTLWGTLLLPTTATTTASVPVLLILNTNTVYDRDGISRHNRDSSNYGQYLAEALAGEGIATFRYDTRGSGKSRDAYIDDDFHDFERTILDACGWVDSLRKDKRLGAITILGLSRPNDFGREGALAGIITAYRQQVDGLIMVAPDSRRWLRYMRSQAAATFPEGTAREIDSLASMLENGRRPQLTPKDGILYDLMRPSLQKYILSLNKYEPLAEIAKLTIPIIGVHGTLDFSIGDEHTRNMVAANSRAQYFSVKNMSFNLKDGNQDLAMAPMEKKKLPILPEVVDLFANFVWSIEKQQP
ncbi:MAG: alpha/beta hydrolase [Candidatus Kapabacteria bacterium]|nr:alpha/beta hydrolase [Candidatus Kapabacteria bacterium]